MIHYTTSLLYLDNFEDFQHVQVQILESKAVPSIVVEDIMNSMRNCKHNFIILITPAGNVCYLGGKKKEEITYLNFNKGKNNYIYIYKAYFQGK